VRGKGGGYLEGPWGPASARSAVHGSLWPCPHNKHLTPPPRGPLSPPPVSSWREELWNLEKGVDSRVSWRSHGWPSNSGRGPLGPWLSAEGSRRPAGRRGEGQGVPCRPVMPTGGAWRPTGRGGGGRGSPATPRGLTYGMGALVGGFTHSMDAHPRCIAAGPLGDQGGHRSTTGVQAGAQWHWPGGGPL